jgi:hypothetical protein
LGIVHGEDAEGAQDGDEGREKDAAVGLLWVLAEVGSEDDSEDRNQAEESGSGGARNAIAGEMDEDCGECEEGKSERDRGADLG